LTIFAKFHAAKPLKISMLNDAALCQSDFILPEQLNLKLAGCQHFSIQSCQITYTINGQYL
jgi:hypothetical protein